MSIGDELSRIASGDHCDPRDRHPMDVTNEVSAMGLLTEKDRVSSSRSPLCLGPRRAQLLRTVCARTMRPPEDLYRQHRRTGTVDAAVARNAPFVALTRVVPLSSQRRRSLLVIRYYTYRLGGRPREAPPPP